MPDGYPRAEEVSVPEELAGAVPLRGKLGAFAGTAGAVLALDILTKLLVQQTLRPYEWIPVFGDFFRLTYIHNPGAAFGLHLGPYSRFIFLALAFVALVVLFVMYRHTPANDRLRLFAIGAIAGGALGNVIDRIRSAEGVVDFLDFGIGNLRWPVFNIADTAVTIGAILLLASLWAEDQRRDHEKSGSS
ncbi:MAG: signal peptidase II [Gemmatimonadota bacterium]|nr:MAG: signal peptidase II [Gemmatimonadota bacterium]